MLGSYTRVFTVYPRLDVMTYKFCQDWLVSSLTSNLVRDFYVVLLCFYTDGSGNFAYGLVSWHINFFRNTVEL